MSAEPLGPGDPAEIAGYRLQARLGAGGMGRVYLALTPGGRTVAVKVMRPELGDDPDFRQRFRQETRAARQVHGLYTAQVLDADPDASPPWLATAYVPGPSLQQAVAEYGPMPAGSALSLTAGVAEALQAIHAAGIVHRDLKPSNVLLAPDGPHVIDFGIARAAEATALTRTGIRVGSPQFMAPEQIQDLPVTPAIDVFALGSLVMFAATGRTPFGEGAEAAVMYRVLHEPPQLAGCPESLRAIVERCLAKEPSARPSPAQLVVASQAARSVQVPARPVPPQPGAVPAGQASAPQQAQPAQVAQPPGGPQLAGQALAGQAPIEEVPAGQASGQHGRAAQSWLPPAMAAAVAAFPGAGAQPPAQPAGSIPGSSASAAITPAGAPTISHTRQAPAPRVRRLPWTSRPVLIDGATAAAVLIVLAVIALRAFASPAGQRPGSAGSGAASAAQVPGSHVSPAASPGSPSASASAPASPSACLVGGTWIATSDQVINHIDTEPVQFTGVGATETFAADGRAVYNWGKGIVYKGAFHGVSWTEIIHGRITMHYEVRNSSLLYSDAVAHHGGWTLYEGGVLNNSGPLSLEPGGTRFTCTGRTLKQFDRSGSTELARVRSG